MLSEAQRNMERARPDAGPRSAPRGLGDAPEQDAAEGAGGLPACWGGLPAAGCFSTDGTCQEQARGTEAPQPGAAQKDISKMNWINPKPNVLFSLNSQPAGCRGKMVLCKRGEKAEANPAPSRALHEAEVPGTLPGCRGREEPGQWAGEGRERHHPPGSALARGAKLRGLCKSCRRWPGPVPGCSPGLGWHPLRLCSPGGYRQQDLFTRTLQEWR